MKIPWGSSSLIRMRLIIAAVIIFVLVVLLWPSHTIYTFWVQPGLDRTVSFTGKDFEYSVIVHSIDTSSGTAELSVFIPAWSVYSESGSGSYTYSNEQNRAVTLKDFKVGQIYEFNEGDNSGPLFKLEELSDDKAVFSILDSWTSDTSYNRGIELTSLDIVPFEPISVATDKAKYAQGETVNISVINGFDIDLEVCSTLFKIGRMTYSDDRIEWRQLMLGNAGYSANETFTLHASESIAASWNQTEQVWSGDRSGIDTIQVAPGHYKIEAITLPGKDLEVIFTSYAYSCYDIPPAFPLDESGYSVIIEIE